MIRSAVSAALLCAASLLSACGPSDEERKTANNCDVQAANPHDEQRVAPGVELDKIIPRLAIEACEKALKDFPDEPRLIYQLGRAYAVAGQPEAATKSYERAMGKGYAMAFVNRGSQLEDLGQTEGAIAAYKKGAELGSSTAKERLAALTFVADGFSNPEFFKSIYEKKFAGRDNSQVIYVATFVSLFYNTEGCRGVATNSLYVQSGSLGQRAVFGQVLGALKQSQQNGTIGFNEGQDARNNIVMKTDADQSDANLFYKRYQCQGPVATQFFKNLSVWVNQ